MGDYTVLFVEYINDTHELKNQLKITISRVYFHNIIRSARIPLQVI